MSINTTKPKRSRKTRFIVDSAGIRHALTLCKNEALPHNDVFY